MPHVEIRLVADLGVFVPWANELAIVAAIHAVSDQRAKALGYAPLELDGQVRDAAPSVELMRGHDRSRRTDIETGTARSAMSADRSRDGQWQIGRASCRE